MRSILRYVVAATKRSKYPKAAIAAVLIAAVAGYCALGAFGPMGTPHDFHSSSWARGTMCSPCHAPQGGWNHRLSTRTYIISTSPTLDAADFGQPRGVSARCLSCHDGTVALDSFGGVTGRTYISPAARVGPDLRSHHPVSFTYNAALAARDGVLRNPATARSGLGGTIAQDLLVGGKLECTSCHDEHTANFLIPLAGGALCQTCHRDGFSTAGHHMPGREDPWNNCTLCHGADLRGGIGPACTLCHNDFAPPDPPSPGHHVPGREDPWKNCTFCHGADLGGGFGPSCTSCHGQLWPDRPPANLPPLADPNGPYTGMAGDPVQFDASGSIDDVAITSYQWSFGDGSTGSGVAPTHTYAGAGLYTVSLTVRDAGGLADTATTTALITANVPPLADPDGPYAGFVGTGVLFDGSGSFDPDGTIVSYHWDFGDGTVGGGVSPIHAYAAAGTFTVTLTVTDDGGLTDTATTTAKITANLPPIVVTGGPYEGLVGEPVDFDLSGTTDPEGDTLIFLWMDWGDGSPLGFPPPLGPKASHTYTAPGKYTVVFSVTDGHHNPTIHEIQVTIADAPPPPTSNTWAVKVPFLFIEFTVKFRDIGGVYLVETTYPDGQVVAGLGMESAGVILWMNLTGTIYFGNVDREAGTMSGIMFDSEGGGSIWFAEQL